MNDRDSSRIVLEERVDTLLQKNSDMEQLNREARDRLSAIPQLRQNLKSMDQDRIDKAASIQELLNRLKVKDEIIREFQVETLANENALLNIRIDLAAATKDMSQLREKAKYLKNLEIKYALLEQKHRDAVSSSQLVEKALKSASRQENKRCREVITLILVINEISRRLLDEPLIRIDGERIAERLKATPSDSTSPSDIIPAIDENRLLELAATLEDTISAYEECRQNLSEKEAEHELLVAEKKQLDLKLTGANSQVEKLSANLSESDAKHRIEMQVFEQQTVELHAIVKREQIRRKDVEETRVSDLDRINKLKQSKGKLDAQFIKLCEKSKTLSAENTRLKSRNNDAKRRLASLNGIQGDSLEELVSSLEIEIKMYEDDRKRASGVEETQHHGIVKMIDLASEKREKKAGEKSSPSMLEYMEQRAKADARLARKRLGPMHRDLQGN
jgi:hypothetical protein